MKKFIPAAIIALLFAVPNVQSQNCSRYYPLNEGTTMTYTNFNGKGKEEGTVTYMVKEVTNNGDTTTASMQMELTDQKGNQALTSEYGITCEGDVVRIDFKSLMNGPMMQQFKDMEVDLTGTDLELPNTLTVGQELPDANIHMKMNMGAMNMNMNIETVNRKVEKNETVTTPAGTYDCVVITSETHTKMMMGNNTYPSRIWLAEGVGMVKQESYNKNGKLMGSMELTSLVK